MTGVYKMMLVARIRKNNITLIGKILGILRARKNCAHYSHIHSRPNYKCKKREYHFPNFKSI